MITFEDEPFKNSFDDDLKGLPLDSEHSKILDRIPDILTPGLLPIYLFQVETIWVSFVVL